jgi:hypothetical protein
VNTCKHVLWDLSFELDPLPQTVSADFSGEGRTLSPTSPTSAQNLGCGDPCKIKLALWGAPSCHHDCEIGSELMKMTNVTLLRYGMGY